MTPTALLQAAEVVAEDYRAETYPDATLAEAIASTRDEVDLDDVDVLLADGAMTAEVAEAYRTVITAPDESIDAVLAGGSR